jgi:isopentenyl-diphosphate delta-isomerase
MQEKQMHESKVILVDRQDNVLGEMDKYTAHRRNPDGHLHRAFSLFLFDSKGRLLLQQRSSTKITFPLIWANTCCSHPEPNEEVIDAAKRRVLFELNIKLDDSACLQNLGRFCYSAHFDDDWTEHEVDHVVFGFYDKEDVDFNKEEVNAVKWVTKEEFKALVKEEPETLSAWIKKIWQEFLEPNWEAWNRNKRLDENLIKKEVINLE